MSVDDIVNRLVNTELVLESYTIIPFSYDDMDYERDTYQDADAADAIFKDRGIRVDSTKEISILAVAGDEVIGAVASGWYREEDVQVFAFDVAVKGGHDKGLVGLKLIEEAIRQYQQTAAVYTMPTMMRLWVINPKLVGILEQRYGFEVEARHGDGSAHLVRY